MVNLNGHEAGNGGYCQEEPIATTPPFYSVNGGEIIKKTTGSVIGDKKEAKKSNEGTERHFSTYLFNPKKRQYVCARHRHGFIYIGTEGSGSRMSRIGDKNHYIILHPICQIERYSDCSVHDNSFVVPAGGRRLLVQYSGGQPLGAQSSIRGHRYGGPLLRMAEKVRARRKFLFASPEPQSHTRAHPKESIGGVRNPERGHRDDVNHRRCKEHFWYKSGWGLGDILPDRQPGDISVFIVVSRATTSKRFFSLRHCPEPANKFTSHSDFSLTFVFGMFKDTVMNSTISKVRANESNSGFTESPSKGFWTRDRDMSFISTTSRFFSSFSETSITGNSLSVMETVKTSDFSCDDSSSNVSDTWDSFKEFNLIFELRQIREGEDLPANRELLEFEMFDRIQELREGKRRDSIQEMTLTKEPASGRVSGDIDRTWEIMLIKDPTHTDFDISNDFRSSTPVAADFAELTGSLVRNEGNGEVILVNERRDETCINFISFSLTGASTETKFSSINEDEFITDRLKEFPEPFIHTDGFDGTMYGMWERGNKLTDFIDTFTVYGNSFNNRTRRISDSNSKRCLMEVDPNIRGSHD